MQVFAAGMVAVSAMSEKAGIFRPSSQADKESPALLCS
jgi:hypothetical protein